MSICNCTILTQHYLGLYTQDYFGLNTQDHLKLYKCLSGIISFCVKDDQGHIGQHHIMLDMIFRSRL